MNIFDFNDRPMLTKTEKSFSILFVLLLALEIATSSFEQISTLNYLAKPALLISLIFYFWSQSKQMEKKIRIMIFYALVFSLLGDILLMFEIGRASCREGVYV